MTETFETAGVDHSDCDAFAAAWDEWVTDLFARGLEPAEEPVSWEGPAEAPTSITYEIHTIADAVAA